MTQILKSYRQDKNKANPNRSYRPIPIVKMDTDPNKITTKRVQCYMKNILHPNQEGSIYSRNAKWLGQYLKN